MESDINDNSPIPVEKSQPGGCSGMAAINVLSIWIIVISILSQVTHWTIWQMIFEGSIKIPNIRWIIELVYGFLLLIPLVIAVWIVKEPVVKTRFKALMNISILAILLTPARLPSITNWQLTVVIELGALIVFLLYIAISNRGKWSGHSVDARSGSGFFLVAAAGGAILGIPWVIWGAQGSLTDTLLAIGVSGGIGIVVADVLVTTTYKENLMD
jgi:hypothetical protein